MTAGTTRELLEGTLLELRRVRKQLREERSLASEPIAIVSMGCRTPGGVVDPAGYWELLDDGRDVIGPFPPRWGSVVLEGPDTDVDKKTHTHQGGFITDVEAFDPAPFGIAPREAETMDPQQRLLLEVAWEALESAGIAPDSLGGTATGVYLGSMGSDYDASAASVASSVLSGRLAYVLGLQGPAMSVDTACSSSLVALHLACTALRQRECQLALAGGVMVMSTPTIVTEFGRLGGLARDGRCKSFSRDADGVGWSEGCGVVVLKRLSDALEAGNRVLALVRGSAVNQDGRSQGLSAPNGPSQQRVIGNALRAAGLRPADIDAVEAHGTGTPLGDPIEAGALAAVFGPTRSAGRPLWVGSSKSNLGHTSAAAGVLGIIKAVLALQHERLPMSLHANIPTEHVDWQGSGLSLLTEAQPWPREPSRPRRIGVSGFGFSGTNAHVVIEEAATKSVRPLPEQANSSCLEVPLLLSARSGPALRAQAARWRAWLHRNPDARWPDVLRTAALARTHLEVRAAVRASDAVQACNALEALSEERPHKDVTVARAGQQCGAVFVFPGQGSQWVHMGRVLLEECQAFAEAVAAADAALHPHTGWSVTGVLRGDPDAPVLTRVDVVQPALFSMAIGLAASWRSLGLEPDAVVGHSQGEIAAAVVAGSLSLQDGARVVALRSRLLGRIAGRGGMATVALPLREVEKRLTSAYGSVSVAAANAPESVLVSGDANEIAGLVKQLTEEGIFCRRVEVDYASHSAHVDGILDELAEALSDVAPNPTTIPMVSTVTGAFIDGTELDATYWCRNLRAPVRFDLALQALSAHELAVFVEVSAHPVLVSPLSSACPEGGIVVGSLTRDASGLADLIHSLGVLHVHGQHVDWPRLCEHVGAGSVDLPTYAFQRQRYWKRPSSREYGANDLGLTTLNHPLLGATTALADSNEFLLIGRLAEADCSWLMDHTVFGFSIVPGTALLELAMTAAHAAGSTRVRELMLAAPLVVPDGVAVQLQVRVNVADAAGYRKLSVHSRPGEATEDVPWTQHASGELATEHSTEPAAPAELQTWPPEGASRIELKGLYTSFSQRGIEYGPTFRGLTEAWRLGDAMYGRVVLPPGELDFAVDYALHPALLDAALHLLGFVASEEPSDDVLLPFAWSDAELYATGATELRVQLTVTTSEPGNMAARLIVADPMGTIVATVGELCLRRASVEQLRAAARRDSRDLYRVDWAPAQLMPASPPPNTRCSTWAVGGDGSLGTVSCSTRVPDVSALRVALDGGPPPPGRLVIDATGDVARLADHGPDGLPGEAHTVTKRALNDLQRILGMPELAGTRLVWVTRRAVAAGPQEEVLDLAHAPVWGLIRSARSEHTDRALRLVDLDVEDPATDQLDRVLATDAEPEIAIRADEARAARLVSVRHMHKQVTRAQEYGTGTFLISGGLGELGQILARHLVTEHGVRHLVLTSRHATEAPASQQLLADLHALGAKSVTVTDCDVSDATQVAAVINAVPKERGLRGVFHLAGALDDGLVEHLTNDQLERVLQPKVDGAWYLHDLTRELELSAFVLFSSASGTLGTPGQANYAAANTFLDALASSRQARGLPGLSLAWGFWKPQGSGMTAHLGAADLARMARHGLSPLAAEAGCALLDATLGRPESALVPIHLDANGAYQHGEASQVPAMFRELVRTRQRRANVRPEEALEQRDRLARMPPSARRDALNDLVRSEVATVLGMPDEQAVRAHVPLLELGIDSLMAVELRNRLRVAVGAEVSISDLFKSDLGSLQLEVAKKFDEPDPTTTPTPYAGLGSAPQSPASDAHEPFPLTPMQQAYWVARTGHTQEGSEAGVSCHFYYEFESTDLDLARLDAAWQAVIARHDALRLVFTDGGFQRVLPEVPSAPIVCQDLREMSDAECSTRLTQVRHEMANAHRPIDQWPLFETRAHLLAGGKLRLHLDMDMLLVDASSIGILLSDWERCYHGAALPELPSGCTFRACVVRQQQLKASPQHRAAMEYWTARRPLFPPIPAVPRIAGRAFAPQTRRREARLLPESWARLKVLARERGLTPSMVVCSAYAEVLSHWAGGDPFVLNLTQFNRPRVHPQVDALVGEFTNLLFLECDLDPDADFDARASQLQAQLRRHLDHCEAINGVEVLRAWSQGGEPVVLPFVFTSILGLADREDGIGQGWLGEPVFGSSQTPQVWLDHIVSEVEGALICAWDAVEARFPPGLLDEMLEAFQRRISLLSESESAWSRAWSPSLSSEQQARIALANDTEAPTSSQTLHGLFAEQVRQRPDHPALVSGERSLSYRELFGLANSLGRRLRSLGVERGDLVGVVMHKSWQQVAGALGILHAGAAYLPVDAGLPAQRCRHLLEAGGVSLVVTQANVDRDFAWAEHISRVVVEWPLEEDDAPLKTPQLPTDVAYVIFTSGSTGKPKGVMIDHRGAVNTILDINRRFGVGPTDRVFALSSLSFDLSVYDVFGLLAAGGTIVVPDAEQIADPAQWPPMLQGVTIWNTVPALLQLLLEYGAGRQEVISRMQDLRLVLLSGDWIPVSLPDSLRAAVPKAKLISLGGATEASIWSILYPVGRVAPEWTSIPYGRPMANQRFHVLDRALEPCPTWVPGELYIGGIGLALGYLSDPERTTERFIEHPRTGERLYRTGDWGRWRTDGNIEFLGRRDQQVKINGFRVELGEIEYALERHPDVRQAAVVAIGEREKRLMAHVVLRDDTGLNDVLARPATPRWTNLPELTLVEEPALRRKLWEAPPGAPDRLENAITTVALPATCEPASAVEAEGARPLDMTTVAAMLEQLRHVPNNYSALPKARYASAGSLYPVQVLVCVNPDGIEGLASGNYYYHPQEHALVTLSTQTCLWRDRSPGRKTLPDSVSCAYLMVGRLGAIAPAYGPLSVEFCAIEAGAMGHLLSDWATAQGLHSYQMHDVVLAGSEKTLGLEPHDILLQALVVSPRGTQRDVDADILASAKRDRPTPDLAQFQILRETRQALQFKLGRHGIRDTGGEAIGLPRSLSNRAVEQRWLNRRSFRTFETRALPLEPFAGLLDAAQPVPSREVHSLAARRPLELYVSVRPGRVRGLSGGLYRYDPIGRQLLQLDAHTTVDARHLPPRNADLASGSAFLLMLVGRMARVAPLFGKQSELACLLETGAICQRLEDAASKYGIGLCQVGGLDISDLLPALQLDPSDLYLHALVGGPVDWSGKQRGWAFLEQGKQPANSASASKLTDGATLLEHCRQSLPEYMVPVRIEVLSSLPLSSNGKIDRGALARDSAEPDGAGAWERLEGSGPLDAEQTAVVMRVAREAFEAPRMAPETPFAELGVDSLMALRFRNRLERTLDRSLPATLVYDCPSVAHIVASLDGATTPQDTDGGEDLLAALGMKIVNASPEEVVLEWTVAPRHHQQRGIVHGGVHCSAVETVCSVGAALYAKQHDPGGTVVGLENQTSFIRPIRQGTLRAVATPMTRGRTTQAWQAEIRDEQDRLVATGRVRLLCISGTDTIE